MTIKVRLAPIGLKGGPGMEGGRSPTGVPGARRVEILPCSVWGGVLGLRQCTDAGGPGLERSMRCPPRLLAGNDRRRNLRAISGTESSAGSMKPRPFHLTLPTGTTVSLRWDRTAVTHRAAYWRRSQDAKWMTRRCHPVMHAGARR